MELVHNICILIAANDSETAAKILSEATAIFPCTYILSNTLSEIPSVMSEKHCDAVFLTTDLFEDNKDFHQYCNGFLSDFLVVAINIGRVRIHWENINSGVICSIFHFPLHYAEMRSFAAMLVRNKKADQPKDHSVIEKELQAQKLQYKNLVDNAPIGIVRRSFVDRTYNFANKEFERQIGSPAKDFFTTPADELAKNLSPEFREYVQEKLTEWKQNNFDGCLQMQYSMTNLSGKFLWTDTYLYVDFDENGDAVAYNQISVDVTELKKNQEIIEKNIYTEYQTTVSNLQNLVVRLKKDENGNIVYTLREGKLAGDKTTELVKGKTVAEAFGEKQSKMSEPPVIEAFAGNSVNKEIPVTKDRIFLYSLNPIFNDNGNVTEVVGSAIDITYLKMVQKLLEESEERYKILADLSPVMISQAEVTDSSFQYIYVNRELTRITGYTLEEFSERMTKESDLFAVHPDDAQTVLSAMKKNNDTNDRLQIEYRFLCKDGKFHCFRNHFVQYTLEDGNQIIIQVGRDITEEKEIQHKLHNIALIPEQANIAIIECDKSFNIKYLNIAAKKIFSEISSLPEEFSTAMKYRNESSFEYDTGKIVLEASLFELEDGSGTDRIFLYDVTQRKKAEENLKETLERERFLNQLKENFVRTVSHEFRTPLTGIMLSVELLQAHSHRLSEEQRSRELSKIKEQIIHLENFLNEFIVHSSLESLRTGFHPNPLHVESVMEEVISQLQTILQKKQQRLLREFPEKLLAIQADREMLRHILFNLLKNAVRYSPNNSDIHIVIEQSDTETTISIIDSGIGIPEQDLPSIFQPYMRAANSSQYYGSGLGLYLTNEFALLHKGSISVQSSINKGSAFIVRFPNKQ